jgi:hypothetical protein
VYFAGLTKVYIFPISYYSLVIIMADRIDNPVNPDEGERDRTVRIPRPTPPWAPAPETPRDTSGDTKRIKIPEGLPVIPPYTPESLPKPSRRPRKLLVLALAAAATATALVSLISYKISSDDNLVNMEGEATPGKKAGLSFEQKQKMDRNILTALNSRRNGAEGKLLELYNRTAHESNTASPDGFDAELSALVKAGYIKVENNYYSITDRALTDMGFVKEEKPSPSETSKDALERNRKAASGTSSAEDIDVNILKALELRSKGDRDSTLEELYNKVVGFALDAPMPEGFGHEENFLLASRYMESEKIENGVRYYINTTGADLLLLGNPNLALKEQKAQNATAAEQRKTEKQVDDTADEARRKDDGKTVGQTAVNQPVEFTDAEIMTLRVLDQMKPNQSRDKAFFDWHAKNGSKSTEVADMSKYSKILNDGKNNLQQRKLIEMKNGFWTITPEGRRVLQASSEQAKTPAAPTETKTGDWQRFGASGQKGSSGPATIPQTEQRKGSTAPQVQPRTDSTASSSGWRKFSDVGFNHKEPTPKQVPKSNGIRKPSSTDQTAKPAFDKFGQQIKTDDKTKEKLR